MCRTELTGTLPAEVTEEADVPKRAARASFLASDEAGPPNFTALRARR